MSIKVTIKYIRESCHWVVAENPDEAYKKVRELFDRKDWAFRDDLPAWNFENNPPKMYSWMGEETASP